MIVRLSQKLITKIETGKLNGMPLDDSPLVDWSAHLFVTGRTNYIILCNTKSLYSTMFLAKGITTEGRFSEAALTHLRDFMEADGLPHVFNQHIAPSSCTIQFARSFNRAVTSSMNELILAATSMLATDDRSLQQVSTELNDILLSAIATAEEKYAKPKDVFQKLILEKSLSRF